MDIRAKDRLRDMLSAEYALGTLRGGARRRFEGWLLDDQTLRAKVAEWSDRLLPFVGAVRPVAPPKRVWDAIEARLPGFAERNGFAAPAVAWWNRLGVWRGLSAAFATVAVVALGLAMRPPPAPQTQFVSVDVHPAAVASLADPKTGAPVAVVLASSKSGALTVEVAAGVQVLPGRDLQLWIARTDAAGLSSVGVLPARHAGEPIRIALPASVGIDRVKAFGLSSEPAGGSPQPTQVLGLGAVLHVAS